MIGIRSVLFDLDGTLLDVDVGEFVPRYVEALTAHMAHLVPPDQFVSLLMQASDAMMVNDGRATNQEVFDRAFFPPLGQTREALEPHFLEFYASEYPKLRRLTRRKPKAREVVQLAFQQGCDVVIATNPLFPRTAVIQRLEWAGVADFPYRLLTTYENSRATKPNPLYFQQVVEAIGRTPQECLMIGDEEMDMAAGAVGCPTFLVPSPRTELASETTKPTYRGTLADLIALLQDDG